LLARGAKPFCANTGVSAAACRASARSCGNSRDPGSAASNRPTTEPVASSTGPPASPGSAASRSRAISGSPFRPACAESCPQVITGAESASA
jgi:hypothetical protein